MSRDEIAELVEVRWPGGDNGQRLEGALAASRDLNVLAELGARRAELLAELEANARRIDGAVAVAVSELSGREIGRRLGVSEAAVRKMLKKS